MLYAICGPSGSGKSTILSGLLRERPGLRRLITFTTREPRQGEIDGIDYHFVKRERFIEMVQIEQIVCAISYRGEFYGTSVADLSACTHTTTVSVLRPDKLPCIRKY